MKQNYSNIWNDENRNYAKLGMILSYLLSAITLVTFVFAIFAFPISGANAPGGGIPYPYENTFQQYPRDFIWQYCAMILLVVFVIQFTCIKKMIHKKNELCLSIGLVFAILSCIVLLVDYYIQVNVIPISLKSNELQGIPLLIQYNPHGIFIALEELGYWLLLISLSCFIPVFWNKKYLSRKISILNSIGLFIGIISYICICIRYGLDKKDRFEVIIISIVWLLLIIDGILIGNRLRKSS